MVKNPVCNVEIEPRQTAAVTEYEGCVYYFCSNNYHKKFLTQPETFVNKAPGMCMSIGVMGSVDIGSKIRLNITDLLSRKTLALPVHHAKLGPPVAEISEMIAEPEQRIGRPRQLYVGSACREYPMARDDQNIFNISN